jgi:hypothetical protein
MANPQWVEKLKARWQVKNAWQVMVILLVFACTGFTVLFIKKPILHFLAGEEGNSRLATILYYIFILPLYNVLLLGYGFLFGQFTFFWQFEKRFVERFFSLFRRHK